MSEDSIEEAAPQPAARRGSMRFRRSNEGSRLSPDGAKRQGAITTLAFELLGRDRALDFLNSDHAELDGRPLDLATASPEGNARVEAELRRIAASS